MRPTAGESIVRSLVRASTISTLTTRAPSSASWPIAGLAEVAADADAPDEAVAAGADDDDTGLDGAMDGLAGVEDEQPPMAIAAMQAQRSHR
jgi:hypothetical protein